MCFIVFAVGVVKCLIPFVSPLLTRTLQHSRYFDSIKAPTPESIIGQSNTRSVWRHAAHNGATRKQTKSINPGLMTPADAAVISISAFQL